jgi:hypothetical protein
MSGVQDGGPKSQKEVGSGLGSRITHRRGHLDLYMGYCKPRAQELAVAKAGMSERKRRHATVIKSRVAIGARPPIRLPGLRVGDRTSVAECAAADGHNASIQIAGEAPGMLPRRRVEHAATAQPPVAGLAGPEKQYPSAEARRASAACRASLVGLHRNGRSCRSPTVGIVRPRGQSLWRLYARTRQSRRTRLDVSRR